MEDLIQTPATGRIDRGRVGHKKRLDVYKQIIGRGIKAGSTLGLLALPGDLAFDDKEAMRTLGEALYQMWEY